MKLSVSLCLFLSLVRVVQASHKVVEHSKSHLLPHVDKLQRASPHTKHQVVFALKQNNLDKIEALLHDVSDPESANYGKHLTRAEILLLTRNLEAVSMTKEHLHGLGVLVGEETLNSDYLVAEASVKVWETLFQTEFYHYTVYGVSADAKSGEAENGIQLIRSEHYSLPLELVDHVECVFHTVQFPVPVKRIPATTAFNHQNHHHRPTVTGNHLRTTRLITKADNSVVVNATYNPYYPFISPPLLNYVYNVPGNIIGNDQTTQGVYETGQAMNPLDLTAFQSYFHLPEEGIALDVGGYVSAAACNPNNNNNPSNNYYSPYYNNYYYGGNNTNSSSYYYYYSNGNACGEANLDVQYIMSMGQHIPTLYYAWNQAYDWLVSWILSISNSHDIADVISISYGGAEQYYAQSYVKQFNLEAMKLAVMGVTLITGSGDDGAVGYAVRFNTSYCGYAPDFPSVSPYVTSVGGTMGPEIYQAEVACQSDTGGIITTGGGFSWHVPTPSFQMKAKQSYFQQTVIDGVDPVIGYNTSGRGYPDISLLASNHLFSNAGGQLQVNAGTSFSAPSFAGMIALINAQRRSVGASSLGWLNPVLYAKAGMFVQDIVSGNNMCAANGNTSVSANCCGEGFTATIGWDPVTGLGSVNFAKMYDALKANPSNNKKGKGLSIGAIVGIVIGGVVFIGLIVALVLYCCVMRNNNNAKTRIYSAPDPSAPLPQSAHTVV